MGETISLTAINANVEILGTIQERLDLSPPDLVIAGNSQ
jgi:hypothetical protein